MNDGPFSTVITTRYEGSDTRTYDGANKVVFKAQACSTAGGCSPWSNPRTVLTGSVSEPIPYDQQLLLEYNVRTGDFDSDGYNDILIERITEGPPDGSFQTTILEGTAGGVVAKVPTANEVNVARSFPSNPQVTAGVSDNNFDGFADIVLSGLGSLGSSSYIKDSLILYASGKPYQSQPKGLKFLDEDYARFLNDIALALGNPNYYSENTQVSIRPIYAPSLFCYEWLQTSLQNLRYCETTVQLVDFEVAYFNIAYHPLAPTVTAAYERLERKDFSAGDPLKALSDAMKPVLGVDSFGFQADGTLADTAYSDDDDVDDAYDDLMAQFAVWVLNRRKGDPQGGNPEDYVRHKYDVQTPICAIGTRTSVRVFPQRGPTAYESAETVYIEPEHCTLDNVYCWQKKNPAPRANGQTTTVANGQQSLLDGGNPIITWVHPDKRVLVNETLGADNAFGASPHVLHDPAQSRDCARNKPDWSDINGPDQNQPSRCSYLHRQTRLSSSGTNIEIATHGEGFNPEGWAGSNEFGGYIIFSRVDRWVQRQLAVVGACSDD